MYRRVFKTIIQELKLKWGSKTTYRLDYLLTVLSTVVGDIFTPIITLVIYSITRGIPGWSYSEILLFQGVFLLITESNRFLFSRIPDTIGHNVRGGSFDNFMLKPMPILTYILIRSLDLDSLPGVMASLGIIGYALFSLSTNLGNIIGFLYLTSLGLLILFSLSLIVGALSFFYVRVHILHQLIWQLKKLARYPLSIYTQTIRGIMTYIVPFGFASFYPASTLIGGTSVLFLAKSTTIALIFFGASYGIWRFGLSHYESAGG